MHQQFIIPKTGERASMLTRIEQLLRRLPIGKGFRVEIHPHNATRSNAQNRYLHGVVYPTILRDGGEAMGGWSAEDLHEFFLCAHFGTEVKTIFRKKRQVPIRRSSRLSKAEFTDFIAFIQRFMAEHGIYVPDADPEWFMHEQDQEQAA